MLNNFLLNVLIWLAAIAVGITAILWLGGTTIHIVIFGLMAFVWLMWILIKEATGPL